MKLYLIRHAQSEANAKGIQQGQEIDSPLTKLGKSQAKKLANRLKDEKIDLIYSSDLNRAKETAKEINRFHDLDIKYDKRIRELAKGENIESLVQRVKSFFEEIKKKDKNILVVAHGGTNLTMLAISTGDKKKGGKLVKRYRQSNTCVNLVEQEGEHYKIKMINSINHFKIDGTLIKTFYKVQKIPYKVCQFEEDKINENLMRGDCRHKSYLLKKLLLEKGYEAKIIKVVFDWKDLSIPKKILDILKKSSTVWIHDAVSVKVHGDYILLDPTWNPELEKKGFPITKEWNGLEDTKQVTEGEITFIKEKEFEKNKEEILKKYKIHIDKGEALRFVDALNKWVV